MINARQQRNLLRPGQIGRVARPIMPSTARTTHALALGLEARICGHLRSYLVAVSVAEAPYRFRETPSSILSAKKDRRIA